MQTQTQSQIQPSQSEIYQMYRKLEKKAISAPEWWSYLSTLPNRDLARPIVERRQEARKRLQSYLNSSLFVNKVRKYCNFHGYTDVHPYEVISVKGKTATLRAMEAILIQPAQVLGIGGFSCISDNQTQRWECVSDEQGAIVQVRLSSKGWGKGRYRMCDEPIKFYDYNF